MEANDKSGGHRHARQHRPVCPSRAKPGSRQAPSRLRLRPDGRATSARIFRAARCAEVRLRASLRLLPSGLLASFTPFFRATQQLFAPCLVLFGAIETEKQLGGAAESESLDKFV